jgi:outer membrane receptor protein involved in Fe transport
VPGVDGLIARGKLKWVHDTDERKSDNPNDNYTGNLYLLFGQVQYQWTDELKTALGYEYQYWDESRRSGSQETGFYDYFTTKHTGRFTAGYNFGGLTFSYLLEYFHKDQDRDRPGSPDQLWNVWRSKATVEVGW